MLHELNYAEGHQELCVKEITAVERAGFHFFVSIGQLLFSIIVIGVSWGVLSSVSSIVGLVFTFLFWVWFGAAICLVFPCICWRAYKNRVFEE